MGSSRLIDTTDARSYEGTRMLATRTQGCREYQLADDFRIHLLGAYAANVGPSWSSHGKVQSDYLSHLNIGISGRRQIVHKGNVVNLEPGQVWFLPGNTPVERRWHEPCEVVYFKFCCELLPGVDPLLDWPGREPRLAGSCDPAKWKSWMNQHTSIKLNDLLRMRGALLQWISTAIPELQQVLTKHLEHNSQFEGVFHVIERELGADLRLCKLSKAHGTTNEAFSMAFVRSTGINPKDYITRRLNQEALQWVGHTQLRMKEIAEKLRFSDEFYFSRFFKKLNGCSPSEYRKRFNQG